MLNDLKVKVAVSWAAAHAILGRGEGPGEDICIRRPRSRYYEENPCPGLI